MTVSIARRRLAVGAVVAMIAAFGVSGIDQAEAAPQSHNLQWSVCYRDVAAGFVGLDVRYECTQVNVPLDYDRPNGPAISLALVRIPAADQANRRGSLFLNPGGPGGSGVDFALGFGPRLPFLWGPVASQFDIVGFDPRGVGRSTPLRCFGNLDQAQAAARPFGFPTTMEELAPFVAANQLLDDQCRQRGSKVLEHMSSANAARDLDVLREAVGDEYLNFWGQSYGSFLGQTYANLFPDRVGAFVIDGVIDPIAWANVDAEVPLGVALRSAVGAQATLEEFLRQCDAAAVGNCALAPDSAARLNALLERLREGPIIITDPETGETVPLTLSSVVSAVLTALGSPFGYAEVAEVLAFVEANADPVALGLAWRGMEEALGLTNKRGFPNYENTSEGGAAVACEDTTHFPGGHAAWFDAGKAATADYGIFGEAWTWLWSPCTTWSTEDGDAYRGPFDTDTAHPILVVGNFYDPATRYEGALAARALLADSALLSVDEPGHVSLGLSSCAAFVTGLYLDDPVGNAHAIDGFVCPSEGNWFDKVADGSEAAGPDASFRAQLMEQMAFRP